MATRPAHANDEPMDLAGLAALHQDWAAWSAGGRLGLGMAWRGPGGSNPAVRVPPAIYQREIAAARELGLPVTVHACGPRTARGQIATMAAAGLLGPDLQIVHANCASDAEIAALAEAGCPVSLSPFSELLIGYGLPRTAELLAAGLPVGLSVDTTALTGNADMFAIMKLTQGLVNAGAADEFAMTARPGTGVRHDYGCAIAGPRRGHRIAHPGESRRTSSWCRRMRPTWPCSPARRRCWWPRPSRPTCARCCAPAGS